MPASISLSRLSWSAPDHRSIFNDLTINFAAEHIGLVGRNGSGKSTLLRLIAGELHPLSGSLRTDASVAIMRQDAMDHPDHSIADLFGITPALKLLNRAEAGLAGADEIGDADWTLIPRVEDALQRCGLSAGPHTLLSTLSGGQRSRAALAALIFAKPDFLLLDEPTNNMDQNGRRAVIDLIRSWSGGAIVASHDRTLLEEMDAIVEITTLGATRYGGNYSAFQHRRALDMDAALQDLANAEKAHTDAGRRAQQAYERKARRDSAGHKARAKADKPKILLDAAKGRAEASKGAGERLREARRAAAEEALSTARQKIEVLQPLRMDIASSGLAPNKKVLQLDNVTGGYAAADPVIRNLSLTITGPEHVLISGPNGSGKTTLLKLITGQIPPQSGRAELMVPWVLLDQHVLMLDPVQTLRENFLRLNPTADRHSAHAALARFGFRADDALRQAQQLSGGERLRAGLACTLGAVPPPMLLILDEPTNHLDLDGIRALEAALAGYDGAVLIISHDETFVQSLGVSKVVTLNTA